MTTYNAIQFSANKIATDLNLFFEIHDHDNLYCTDPHFKEKWGKHIKSLVAERLWGYAGAVFDKPLGEEEFDIDGGRQSLTTALTRFGRVCEEDAMVWNGSAWATTEDDDEDKESSAGSTDQLPCYDCCEPTEDEDLITIEGRGGVCKDCLRGDKYNDVEYEGKEENDAREECEECEELISGDNIYQSDSRFLCEDCFKEFGCCDYCGVEPWEEEQTFSSIDKSKNLCKDCYLEELDDEEDDE